MGINCTQNRCIVSGNCYETNLAYCCNKGPKQRTQVKDLADLEKLGEGQGGDQWSEKILGFDHSSTITNEHYEQDLIKLAGKKKKKKANISEFETNGHN